MKSRLAIIIATFLLAAALPLVGGCSQDLDPEYENRAQSRSLLMSFKNVMPWAGGSTKMSTAVTQSDGSFRGIEQLYVVPFNIEEDMVAAGDARLGTQNVVLGTAGISQSGLVENNNSHLFGSAFVPNGMNHVLVYGKSPDQGESAPKDSKHIYGSLLPQNLINPSGSDDISFKLDSILEKEEFDESAEVVANADALLGLLNNVMSVMASSPYDAIVSIHDAVRRENQILSCSYATFDQIRTEIQNSLLRIPFESTALLEEIGRVITALTTFSEGLTAVGTSFPASYGIPDGSIGFAWNGKEFVRLINDVNIALVDPTLYCYPPSLWYYINSPIKTTNTAEAEQQYVYTNEGWSDILAYYSDGQTVTSLTESVAIELPLEYGVGLMELTLGTPSSDIYTMMKDCPLTGIIIGDQKDVNFAFEPVPGQSQFIYDNTMSGSLRIGSTGSSVLTLVLQTPPSAPVHFALEFKNTSGYIRRGQQGDILPLCKFYLAGVLDPVNDGTQPAGETLTSAFAKDHKTVVSVKVESLKNAYNTVPDLRDPQLEIGIVTEMKWTQLTPQTVVMHY